MIAWAAAAVFAVAALGLGGLYWVGRSEIAVMREQQRLAELELRGARNEIEAQRIVLGREVADAREEAARNDLARFKISRLVPPMPGNSPEAVAVAVWDPARQQGVLDVSNLPKPAADRDYELWVIDPDYPGAVSGGVFRVDPATGEAHLTFRAGRPIRAAAQFEVSLERKGGAEKREGPIVLLSW